MPTMTQRGGRGGSSRGGRGGSRSGLAETSVFGKAYNNDGSCLGPEPDLIAHTVERPASEADWNGGLHGEWEDVADDAAAALLAAPGRGRGSIPSTDINKVGLGQASMFSCIVNLSNTIVGAGILGLPRAFSESGWLVGSALLVLSGFGSALSLHLLAVSNATVGINPSSFYTVAKASVPSFTKLIDVAVMIKCFGVGTSYLIVIGDLAPDVMRFVGGPTSRSLWVSVAFFMVCPLTFLKTLDALKVTSTLALVFVGMVGVIIVAFGLGVPGLDIPCEPAVVTEAPALDVSADETDCDAPVLYPMTDFLRTVHVATIYTFSYTCQQNIFAVCSELKDGTQARVGQVVSISVTSVMVLYMSVAVAGFVTFGDKVESDILNNYPHTNLVTFARIAIVLLVTFSYPLQSHPARRCAISLYSALVLGEDARGEPKPVGLLPFYVFSALFAFGSYGVALMVDDLGIVLTLVGATGSTMVSYILPGAIYWKLHPHPHRMKYLAAMQFCIGCVIIPVALFYDLGIGEMFLRYSQERELITGG